MRSSTMEYPVTFSSVSPAHTRSAGWPVTSGRSARARGKLLRTAHDQPRHLLRSVHGSPGRPHRTTAIGPARDIVGEQRGQRRQIARLGRGEKLVDPTLMGFGRRGEAHALDRQVIWGACDRPPSKSGVWSASLSVAWMQYRSRLRRNPV